MPPPPIPLSPRAYDDWPGGATLCASHPRPSRPQGKLAPLQLGGIALLCLALYFVAATRVMWEILPDVILLFNTGPHIKRHSIAVTALHSKKARALRVLHLCGLLHADAAHHRARGRCGLFCVALKLSVRVRASNETKLPRGKVT